MPLHELSVNPVTPEPQAKPADLGITPGGRHFRAPGPEAAALRLLAGRVSELFDALSAASSPGSHASALSAVDLRLTGLRLALGAVPPVAGQQARAGSGGIRVAFKMRLTCAARRGLRTRRSARSSGPLLRSCKSSCGRPRRRSRRWPHARLWASQQSRSARRPTTRRGWPRC